jgi:hypothetical protein
MKPTSRKSGLPLELQVKSFLYAICAVFLLSLAGCGGGNSSSSNSAVTISPDSATVVTSATQQFTAKVADVSNQDVTWQVNGVTGGNGTYGTISGTGLYTAPASISSTLSVTVTAISVADANKTADVKVTVELPISVSPTAASVEAAETQQFTATVGFSSNKNVSWNVNGIAGGNSTVGTINSSGLYTAPNSVPNPDTVTVTAVANADNSRSASATVTITPPPIVISPTDAVLGAAAQQSYTATVLSSAIHPVWSVTCASSAVGACGGISADGTYTAPTTPPRNAEVTISASMADGSATTESVTATIQFASASLAGTYVFAIADDISHTAPSQVGAIVFDGAGKITSGIFDSTDSPGTTITVTGGTYRVGEDGRGTATLQSATASLNFRFVLASNAYGYLVRTDSSANQASGTIERQQPESLTAAANGRYALSVSGVTASAPVVNLGEAGSIVLTSTGAVAGGIVDVRKNAVLQTTTVTAGSFTQPSIGGRGTLTFATAAGTQTFAYYPVDDKRAKLLAIDGTSGVSGDLSLQPQGPFSSSSLKGRYAYSASGSKTGVPYGVVGVFSLDGSGNVTGLHFDGITQTVFDSSSGAYTVTDSNSGRTTATWTGNSGSKLQYILYPRSDGGMVLLQSDSVYAGSGQALPQADPSLNNFLALRGAFAMSLGGSDVSDAFTTHRATGHLSASTNSSLFGTVDGDRTGDGAELALNLLSQNLSTQRYTLGSSLTTLTQGTIILYRINDDQAFMIVSDESTVLTGDIRRQY